MKKIYLTILILVASLIGCQKNEKIEEKRPEKITQTSLSNMANDESLGFVKDRLMDAIGENDQAKADVEKFIDIVKDYNKSVGEENLIGDFDPNINQTYEVGKFIANRERADKKYPDTNCRINTFLLAKDIMKVQKSSDDVDDSMLFMDEEQLEAGNIFDEETLERFKTFFARIPTVESKDPADHGKVMEEYFKSWSFPENAHLLSIVINDVLDGNFLFIGHIGLLIEIDGGYLFVEKISFEEPYQAIKFPDKISCYDYLREKFENYTDPETADPFLMDNGKFVE